MVDMNEMLGSLLMGDSLLILRKFQAHAQKFAANYIRGISNTDPGKKARA